MLGGTKHCSTKAETISRGASASRMAKWGCPSTQGQLQATRSGVELSQIQHLCSPVTVTLLLCSINSGMGAVPILLGYGVAGQPPQQAAASASPASCTFNFPQKHTFHGQHKGCSYLSLLHVYKPLISLKKRFSFPDFCM